MLDSKTLREQMVENQIARRGVTDVRVLAAMREVLREDFVGEETAAYAYDDNALRIDAGQTISQPYIVALMAAAAELRATDKVLEIGTGSGYAAAVCSRLCRTLFTIERHPSLAGQAAARLKRAGCDNVRIRIGDGTLGWPEEGPFDAIIVTAADPFVPPALRDQLAPGGRLVIPVGDAGQAQRLMKITRREDGAFDEDDLGGVAFVPLIGAQGVAADA